MDARRRGALVALVGDPDRRERRVAQGPGRLGDLVEDLVEAERGRDRQVPVVQPLEPVDVVARLVVQPRVLHRHRGQRGEGRQASDLAGVGSWGSHQ